MFEVDQIFVRASSRETVTGELRRILESRGFSASDRVLPVHDHVSEPASKPYRHFFVSLPHDGWVCILESLGGEEELARDLSKGLATTSVWLSFSTIAEEFSYLVFSDGQIKDQRSITPQQPTKRRVVPRIFGDKTTSAAEELVRTAQQFYADRKLPWPLYSYEQIDASPNKTDYFLHLNFRSALL